MSKRIDIKKTYKLYIDGKFPRTESGRYIKWTSPKDKTVKNICRGSRKDFRNAIVAARKAFSGWSERTAYNRSQIIYRIGEMFEGTRDQFLAELLLQGSIKKQAEKEINQSIDRLIYYAGWADKYQQVFSRVNPVSLPYFNFTLPESTGVVAVIAPEESSPLSSDVSVTVLLNASSSEELFDSLLERTGHTGHFGTGGQAGIEFL